MYPINTYPYLYSQKTGSNVWKNYLTTAYWKSILLRRLSESLRQIESAMFGAIIRLYSYRTTVIFITLKDGVKTVLLDVRIPKMYSFTHLLCLVLKLLKVKGQRSFAIWLGVKMLKYSDLDETYLKLLALTQGFRIKYFDIPQTLLFWQMTLKQ